jgi:Icc-related predicted phosphoesterase
LKCIFVTDLHGDCEKFEVLFKTIKREKPDGVFIGGDLLPNQFSIKNSIEEFLEEEFFSKIDKILNELEKKINFFVIMGNDDPRVFEEIFKTKDKEDIIDYVHFKTKKFESKFVTGYSYVPPTPFQLKDWERYDVSRYVDVGAISPESGIRTVKVDEDEIIYSTISKDLDKLSKNSPTKDTIFLFHSPPYKSMLDRADLDGKKVDHAPLDVNVGSIAIQRFIEKKQPFLTLHGHVHETVRLSGNWREKRGKSHSFTAVHDGPELALIRFDTENLEDAKREIIPL